MLSKQSQLIYNANQHQPNPNLTPPSRQQPYHTNQNQHSIPKPNIPNHPDRRSRPYRPYNHTTMYHHRQSRHGQAKRPAPVRPPHTSVPCAASGSPFREAGGMGLGLFSLLAPKARPAPSPGLASRPTTTKHLFFSMHVVCTTLHGTQRCARARARICDS